MRTETAGLYIKTPLSQGYISKIGILGNNMLGQSVDIFFSDENPLTYEMDYFSLIEASSTYGIFGKGMSEYTPSHEGIRYMAIRNFNYSGIVEFTGLTSPIPPSPESIPTLPSKASIILRSAKPEPFPIASARVLNAPHSSSAAMTGY